MKRLAIVLSAALAAACAQVETAKPVAKLKDQELSLPANYRSWPAKVMEVQRPDVKQVRDIFVSPEVTKTVAGKDVPNGTYAAMDLYKAKENADGTLMKAADGKLVKGDMIKTFVMQKGEGWGEGLPPGVKNGDWVYGSIAKDGKTVVTTDKMEPCRTCHLKVEGKDFLFRYDDCLKAKS